MNTTKTKIKLRLAALLLGLPIAACGVLEGEQNDGQIGDDDIGAADEVGDEADGGDEWNEPEPVVDHGVADFCVERVQDHTENGTYFVPGAEQIADHERWATHIGRTYDGHLSIKDKPSPKQVPLMCPIDWPHFEDYAGQALKDGGSPSCLNANYHLQLPFLGFSDWSDPGYRVHGYSRDIMVSTIGNPPESGRHTLMDVGCCAVPPTELELDSPTWHPVVSTYGLTAFAGKPDADCAAYVGSVGVHSDAEGYPALYAPAENISGVMTFSTCNNSTSYDGIHDAMFGALKIGAPIHFHPTRSADQAPINLNYEYMVKFNTFSWEDFAAFGPIIDGAIKWLIGKLYLPPGEEDYPHARMRAGGFCHFPVALRWSNSSNTIGARFTCPLGYYADFPNFYVAEETTQINGVVGTCRLDGGEYGSGSGFAPQGRVVDYIDGHNSGFGQVGQGGAYYVVSDPAKLGELFEAAEGDGRIGPELAQLLSAVDADGSELDVVSENAAIEWWSSPHRADPQPIADALVQTFEYDLDALLAEGIDADDAKRWADGPIQRLSELVEGLPEHLADRSTVTLREHHTWHLRVRDRVDGQEVIKFLHFVENPNLDNPE